MPIEFYCSECQSKLKVPDKFAGKTAKCPKCSNLNTIPDGLDPLEPLPMDPLTMDPEPMSGMDFSAPIEPAPQQSRNPYSSSPVSPPRTAPRRHRGLLVLRKVDINSAALMCGGIYAVIGLAYALFLVGLGGLGLALNGGRAIGPGPGLSFAYWIILLIVSPVACGIAGLIGGAVLGGIYNVAAHFLGGLRFETD